MMMMILSVHNWPDIKSIHPRLSKFQNLNRFKHFVSPTQQQAELDLKVMQEEKMQLLRRQSLRESQKKVNKEVSCIVKFFLVSTRPTITVSLPWSLCSSPMCPMCPVDYWILKKKLL